MKLLKPIRHANDQQTTSEIANKKKIWFLDVRDVIDSDRIISPFPLSSKLLRFESHIFASMRLSLVRRRMVPVSDKLRELYPELRSPPTRLIV